MENKIPLKLTSLGSIVQVYKLEEGEKCFICEEPIQITGETPQQLLENLKQAGYSTLDSDFFGMIGFYCGCDYETWEEEE